MENNNIIDSDKLKALELKVNKLRKDLAYHKNMVNKIKIELENAKKELKKAKINFLVS